MAEAPRNFVQLADAIEARLTADFGTGRFVAEEWRRSCAEPRFFQRWRVLCRFQRSPGHTLGFLLSPTDPAERAYKRTNSYDVVYFSEDVADNEQAQIYYRDRQMIDRFVAWVTTWDKDDCAD